MNIDKEIIQGYDEIDAKWRCVHRVDKGIFAEVIDRTTGEIYAEAAGVTEQVAIANALEVARRTPKPLTRAQKADPVHAEAASLKQQLEEANAEIAKLRASKQRRGRKPKAEDAQAEADGGFPEPASFPSTDSD